MVCCFEIERQNFGYGFSQQNPNISRPLGIAPAIDPSQHFPESESAGQQLIPALLHPRLNLLYPARILRIIFEPINEQHRVPVDAAHFSPRFELTALRPEICLTSSQFLEDVPEGAA